MYIHDHGGFKVEPFQPLADGLVVEAEVIDCTTKVNLFAISANHAELDFLMSDEFGKSSKREAVHPHPIL
jgi:hypothetical protein